MFDGYYMIESADNISIMEAVAELDNRNNLANIEFMESGDEKNAVSKIIDNIKDFIDKIVAQIQAIIDEVAEKVHLKIAENKAKHDIKKLKKEVIANREKYAGRKFNVIDKAKILKLLNGMEKDTLEYYRWVAGYKVTKENAEEFLTESEKRSKMITAKYSDAKFDEAVYQANMMKAIDEYTGYIENGADNLFKAARSANKATKNAVDDTLKKMRGEEPLSAKYKGMAIRNLAGKTSIRIKKALNAAAWSVGNAFTELGILVLTGL